MSKAEEYTHVGATNDIEEISKAEKAAWKVYPEDDPYGLGVACREAYQYGYQQAEKDLGLTPDDIKLITKIHYEIVFKDTTGIKVGDVASEVLKRYLEAKQ